MKHVTLPAEARAGQGDLLPPRPREGSFVVDRWKALQLVKDVRKQLGIGPREIAVLQAHLSVLSPGPIKASDLLMSYAEVQGILDRAGCMCERRLRRGEKTLEAAGLITRRISANGRRFPVRDGKGTVIDAYGIDLRPLFLRIRELEGMREKMREEEAYRKALKTRISSRISDLKRRSLEAAGAVPDYLQQLAERVRSALRRAAITLAEMRSLEAEIEAVANDDQLGDLPTSTPVAHGKITCEDTSNTGFPADRQAVDGGQSVRHIESPRKDNTNPPGSERRAGGPNPLAAWRSCTSLVEMYPEEPRSERDIAVRIVEFSGFLGLRQHQALDALRCLGTARMLLILDYLATRVHAITHPGAYVDAMLRKWKAGQAIAGGRVAPL